MLPGNSTWKELRVHSQPKTTVAAETAVRISHCTVCARDGTQSVSTPNAEKSAAATIANAPAEIDSVAPAPAGLMIA